MNGLIVKANSILRPLTVLSLEERRLFSFCLQHYDSRKNADNPALFSVPLEKFKEAYPEYREYKPSHIFRTCKAAINGIQSKGYQPDPNDDYVIWWFSSLDLRDGENLKFALTPAAMPYFLNLSKNFISYHMLDVKLMSKTTAWNLYEYIKERFQNGQIPEWTETVVELRDRLRASNKYPRFADFNKRCLGTPQKDINKLTDLHFDYYKIKRGKAVFKVKFKVFKKCSNPDVIDVEDLAKTFKRELENNGVNSKVVAHFVAAAVKQSRVSEMIQKIPKAKKSHTRHGKGTWTAYLCGMLRNELYQGKLFDDAPATGDSQQAEQAACWESLKGYGCNFLGTMGTKEICNGCDHNK